MTVPDPIRALQAYIDERWAVAHPKFFPDAIDGPRVPPDVSPNEARFFLAAVTGTADEKPLLVVDDDRKERSDRYPRLADGSARGYNFFEAPGRLRLETIVYWAAMSRLRHEFGWPRDQLVCESPTIVEEGRELLHYDALDILLLAKAVAVPPAKMTLAAARPRMVVEAKADAKKLHELLEGMRGCQTGHFLHARTDHAKCSSIAVLRPRFFVGVAASDTWRLFTVIDREGRAVLGEEQIDLAALRFPGRVFSD